MLRFVSVSIAVIITSFFFFPFEFTFLPGINTKMAMAAVGLLVLGVNMSKKRDSLIDKNFFVLSLLACGISLISYVSVAINGTSDFSYVTYIISMWVWTSAAYVVVSLLELIHGKVSVRLICNYLILTCVVQCILALLIDNIDFLNVWVKRYFGSFSGMVSGSAAMLEARGRLYGIGAALDIAGTRFASILVMITFWGLNSENRKMQYLYVLAFFIVVLIGNMISRTTIIGVLLAFIYIIYKSFKGTDTQHHNLNSLLKIGALFLFLGLPVIVYLYKSNVSFYENIRFAFEGFFSLYETGSWETNSTNILENMYVFPDNWRTWLIGDGYFDNPTGDPYYVGYMWKGFYYGTDVGYLRFIFYVGVLGLISMASFMIATAIVCMRKFAQYRDLFMMLIVLNFIIWLKVSTDIFLVFTPFLCLNSIYKKEFE